MPPTRSAHSMAPSLAGTHLSPASSIATTRASLDFPRRPDVLVTRADLRHSVSAYEQLLASGKALTNAMLVLSRAAADFATSLETCSKVKGAHAEAENLQACAGLHFLTSNWSQVLADSFWKDFQIPLLSAFDTYRSAHNERQLLHEKTLADKSRALKETEARNIRNGLVGRRGPGRDLASFKLLLAEMQQQVAEIDDIKADWYHEVLGAEEEMWEYIQSKISLLSRSQVEMWERLSSKANSDPVLEHILASIPDPFDSYGAPASEDQILSIIPPSSLLSSYTGSQFPRTAPTSTKGSANGSAAAAAALATRDEPTAHGPGHVAGSPSSTPTKAKSKAKAPEGKSPRLREEALFDPSDSEDSRSNGDYAILTAPASAGSSNRSPDAAQAESTIKAPREPSDEQGHPVLLAGDAMALSRVGEEQDHSTSPTDADDEGTGVKFPGSPSEGAEGRAMPPSTVAGVGPAASQDVSSTGEQAKLHSPVSHEECATPDTASVSDEPTQDTNSEDGATVRNDSDPELDLGDDAASNATIDAPVGALPAALLPDPDAQLGSGAG